MKEQSNTSRVLLIFYRCKTMFMYREMQLRADICLLLFINANTQVTLLMSSKTYNHSACYTILLIFKHLYYPSVRSTY